MTVITPNTNPELYTTNKSATGSDAAGAALSGDFSFFLKMLTTQLQNQDPTSPMDVSQMTSQIAQYSGVEQQVETNKNLETLINANKQSQLSTAVSYIGKQVETTGNKGQLYSNADAVFSYQLPAGVSSTVVTITNSAGAAVFQGAGTKTEGTNLVTWDGTNSFTGAKEAAGDYSISVTAKDAGGQDISTQVTTRTVGNVVSVETETDGTIKLMVGDLKVNFSDVLAVRQPIISQANSGDTTTGDTTTGDTTTGSST